VGVSSSRAGLTRLPSGIDLKTAGYMIMPPSRHPATRQAYRWEHHPVAPPPPRLRQLLRPAARPVRRSAVGGLEAMDGLLRMVAGASVGNRNNVCIGPPA
jgi:Bifunctional DNA primase/polymerase, N-terminal